MSISALEEEIVECSGGLDEVSAEGIAACGGGLDKF